MFCFFVLGLAHHLPEATALQRKIDETIVCVFFGVGLRYFCKIVCLFAAVVSAVAWHTDCLQPSLEEKAPPRQKKLKTKMHRWKTHCCNLGVTVPTKADLLSASSFIPNVSSWARSGSLPSRMQAGANKLAPSFKVGPHREPPK